MNTTKTLHHSLALTCPKNIELTYKLVADDMTDDY